MIRSRVCRSVASGHVLRPRPSGPAMGERREHRVGAPLLVVDIAQATPRNRTSFEPTDGAARNTSAAAVPRVERRLPARQQGGRRRARSARPPEAASDGPAAAERPASRTPGPWASLAIMCASSSSRRLRRIPPAAGPSRPSTEAAVSWITAPERTSGPTGLRARLDGEAALGVGDHRHHALGPAAEGIRRRARPASRRTGTRGAARVGCRRGRTARGPRPSRGESAERELAAREDLEMDVALGDRGSDLRQCGPPSPQESSDSPP